MVKWTISINEFSKFWIDFHKFNKYPNQRLGQAFYNTFAPEGAGSDPELFYEKDENKVKKIIVERYLSYLDSHQPNKIYNS